MGQYWALILVIGGLKLFGFLSPFLAVGGLVLLASLPPALPRVTAPSVAVDPAALAQLNAAAAALGLPPITPNTPAPQQAAAPTEPDLITGLEAAIAVGVFMLGLINGIILWAIAHFLEAVLEIAENSRYAPALLSRR